MHCEPTHMHIHRANTWPENTSIYTFSKHTQTPTSLTHIYPQTAHQNIHSLCTDLKKKKNKSDSTLTRISLIMDQDHLFQCARFLCNIQKAVYVYKIQNVLRAHMMVQKETKNFCMEIRPSCTSLNCSTEFCSQHFIKDGKFGFVKCNLTAKLQKTSRKTELLHSTHVSKSIQVKDSQLNFYSAQCN